MTKLDLRKDLKHLYQPSAKAPVLVDVPEMQFLMLDGRGDPNASEEFQGAIMALYSVAYTLKFAVKKGPLALDYPVMPLEGLWGADTPIASIEAFEATDKSQWRWTLMIMTPEAITEELVTQAAAEAAKKKELPLLGRLRLETFHEGLSAQIMHLGPYAEERPALEKLHAFAREQGYELHGKHHEIYLGDPRRTAPERLKTVLRHPVRKA
jgi:hypothetical protein